MILEGTFYQFLSRRAGAANDLYGLPATSENVRQYRFSDVHIENRSFEINFASITPQAPSIGAHQHVDAYVDVYMQERWPTCVAAKVQVDIDGPTAPEPLQHQILFEIREIMFRALPSLPILSAVVDQLSRHRGYRRSYGSYQSPDILGNRRPSSSEYYHPAEVGEFVGPGVANLTVENRTYEFVWSQIIPFRNVQNTATDIAELRRVVEKIRLHHNSYNELRDARQSLEDPGARGIKGCVRSAASGIDAILRFYCGVHGVRFPSSCSLQFDDKIERILTAAGMPSYRTTAPTEMQHILYLYRARNSQHEGEASYRDVAGHEHQVDIAQAKKFLDAAVDFAVWLDAAV